MDRPTSDLLEAGATVNSPTYAPAPIVVDHGEGMYVYDREGEPYLDFIAGIAVNALGYNHPDLTEAIRGQASRAIHVSNMYYTAEQIELQERLVEQSFGDRVFLCNSGTEATEASMKLARRYQRVAAGREDQRTIVSMEKSFHGRTMGAITATGQPKYHRGFEPMLPDVEYAPFNDAEAAVEIIDEGTAAVIVEPVQGEGGVRPAEREFLELLRERCDQVGALLIFDEVQTGVGRTGELFAYQTYGVEPDIMALAKGLGGGVPVGACVATERAFEGWTTGSHASTFGGNPLASAAASTVLDVVERDDLCENARRRGEELKSELEDLAERFDLVREVRGRGLLVGAECGDLAGEVVDRCREEGLLINTAGGDTLRFAPPLIASSKDVAMAADRLERAFRAVT